MRTITLSLPQGMAFTTSRKIVIYDPRGKKPKFAAAGRGATLRLTLQTPASAARIVVPSAAMSVTRLLAHRVSAGTVTTVTVLVSATETNRATTKLRMWLKA